MDFSVFPGFLLFSFLFEFFVLLSAFFGGKQVWNSSSVLEAVMHLVSFPVGQYVLKYEV